MLTALTRALGPSIDDCQLTYLDRQPIDFHKAARQHQMYELCLRELGVDVVSLPPEPECPDAVFVEDAAVIVDELAVIANMGSKRRRQEIESLASVLSQYRPLAYLNEPATLDGGDVLRIGRALYVGRSSRTNEEGITELRRTLEPFAYKVISVNVSGCLHLKTGCTFVGNNTILVNHQWVDTSPFSRFEILRVAQSEAWAANALIIRETILYPDSFPLTAGLLEERGFHLKRFDISELMKAEAGLTCMSLLFESD